MPMIRECVVTTVGGSGLTHLANLESAPFATASFTDDVRIFAGCVCGRGDWPLEAVPGWSTPRLAGALSHAELEVVRHEADPQRPRFFCHVKKIVAHRPFLGFNRAQAAVIEAAILATRLGLLPREKIDTEMAYLKIAVDKTAGRAEREAWDLLAEKIDAFLQTQR